MKIHSDKNYSMVIYEGMRIVFDEKQIKQHNFKKEINPIFI